LNENGWAYPKVIATPVVLWSIDNRQGAIWFHGGADPIVAIRDLVATLRRSAIDSFFIGQEFQQPIVLNFISRRIALRLGDQPTVMRQVLPMHVLFHGDLRYCPIRIMCFSSEAVDRLTSSDKGESIPRASRRREQRHADNRFEIIRAKKDQRFRQTSVGWAR
jgi:hypothetical protein